MRQTTAWKVWSQPAQHQEQEGQCSAADARVSAILETAGIAIDGSRPWDIQVKDKRFYRRILRDGTLGLGETYMDGWWDTASLDEVIARAKREGVNKRVAEWGVFWLAMKSKLQNLQSLVRSKRVAFEHYDLGNDLYRAMLGPSMQYTCAYWPGAATLEQAQRNKLDLTCKKLQLAPGMRILELGGGFGGFAQFAAAEYGCEVVSYNISTEQVAYARELCRGLPVRFELKDYRDARNEGQSFDRVVSVGMCEHIGQKNFRTFLETGHARLKPRGLFLLQTIGGNESFTYTDPWIHKYIFPNGLVPSIAQLGRAAEGLWVVEDWHNFGPDYDRTLMAWWEHFDEAWPRLRGRYGDRFYRMWKYYLQASAGSFRARALQLWQIVLSKGDIARYTTVR